MAGYPPQGPGAPPYPTGGGGYPPAQGPGYPAGPPQGGYPQSAPQPQMQQQKIPASKVELYISCADLLRMDVTSASDPIAILHLYDKPTKKWNEVMGFLQCYSYLIERQIGILTFAGGFLFHIFFIVHSLGNLSRI